MPTAIAFNFIRTYIYIYIYIKGYKLVIYNFQNHKERERERESAFQIIIDADILMTKCRKNKVAMDCHWLHCSACSFFLYIVLST